MCALRDINVLVPTIAVLFGVQFVLVPNFRVSPKSGRAEKSPREVRGHKLASQRIFLASGGQLHLGVPVGEQGVLQHFSHAWQ